ncbi:MAG TPA: hypothetical protein VHA10_24625, partial [Hypericibacter adhaerens]|uniref:hypothetical protein n=1 Tax=Hypericibacter adhaerens TaxID=2602016 RepID=UPI002CDCFE63
MAKQVIDAGPRRDSEAGWKMRGALLRLDAAAFDGFTAERLGEEADVSLETARGFLKEGRFTQAAEAAQDASPRSAGRPPKLYRLSDAGRRTLTGYTAEARRDMAGAPSAQDWLAPLELLEETLNDLREGAGTDRQRQNRLRRARLELAGCQADLRALEAEKGRETDARRYRFRLQNAEALLKGVEPPPVATQRAEPGRPVDRLVPQHAPDPVAVFVGRFGSWLKGMAPQTLEPVLLFFDGVRAAKDPLADSISDAYLGQGMPVARFDVANMPSEKRQGLYSELSYMRAATPLAICDVIMTVDGREPMAQDLAHEFRDLRMPHTRSVASVQGAIIGDPDSVPLHIAIEPGDIVHVHDIEAIREEYLRRCASMISGLAPASDKRRLRFARQCTAALSALAAVEVEDWVKTDPSAG